MTILELFKAVKESNLSKDILEDYHTQLTSLFAQMHLEVADLEKEEAMFFLKKKGPEISDVSIKRDWRATDKGQRQIELTHYIKASEKILSSLKSRLYSVY